LISPHLAEDSSCGACLLSEDEKISIMINEEDHIRIQCIYPGLQLKEACIWPIIWTISWKNIWILLSAKRGDT